MKKTIILVSLMVFLMSCAKTGEISISEAARLGAPVVCTTKQGDQTSTIYLQGSKMRMDTLPADAHAIYTEDRVYMWMGRQGSMMKRSDLEKLARLGGQPPKSQEEIVAGAEQADARCSREQVSSDLFVPPKDVQFQDVGELVKQHMGTPIPK